MRVLIQKVTEASVTVDNQIISQIQKGLLVLVGIEDADDSQDIEWLSNKIVNLRIFENASNIMNLSLLDVQGELLLVSQFTLHANTKKGNRPSYIKASKAAIAEPMYQQMANKLSTLLGKPVALGKFGAEMKISLINDGPTTIWMDSKNKE